MNPSFFVPYHLMLWLVCFLLKTELCDVKALHRFLCDKPCLPVKGKGH